MEENKILKKFETTDVEIEMINGEPMFEIYSTGIALGYVNYGKNKDNPLPHKSRIIKVLENAEIIGCVHGVNTYITETQLYDFMLEAHTAKCKEFKKWLTTDVLPSIRKTGGYVANDELFVDTYLQFADDSTKMMFRTTLATVREQNEKIKKQNLLIKKQQGTIQHKQEVINGFVEDIDIYKKKDIINRICRKTKGNYTGRYKELYRCFRETYHIDLEARCEGFNMKQLKKKDQLSIVKYAEKFGHIDNLYDCCAKLYETEVKQLLKELNLVQN